MELKQQPHPLHTAILVLCCLLCGTLSMNGQSLWPGDINNNGEVDKVDLLFFGLAREAEGPEREVHTTDWAAQAPPDPWSGTYANGINYCQADVDGKGDVDNDDRKAILEENYGKTHGVVSPEVYLVGNPDVDPTLLLVPETEYVEEGKKLKVDLFLGDVAHQVDQLFGIAFTLNYNPELVKDDKEDDLHDPSEIKFKLQKETWINGDGSNKSEAFTRVNNQLGKLDVVIIRKEPGHARGFGHIGRFEIVMEDILLDVHDPRILELYIGDIKLIDEGLNDYPIASSTVQVLVVHEDYEDYYVDQRVQDNSAERAQEMGPSEKEELLNTEAIEVTEATAHIYPNPARAELWIEYLSIAEEVTLEQIDLYNRLGQLVRSVNVRQDPMRKQRLDVTVHQPGLYLLKLYTSQGVSVHQVMIK